MTGFFENVYEYTYNDIKLKRMNKENLPKAGRRLSANSSPNSKPASPNFLLYKF